MRTLIGLVSGALLNSTFARLTALTRILMAIFMIRITLSTRHTEVQTPIFILLQLNAPDPKTTAGYGNGY